MIRRGKLLDKKTGKNWPHQSFEKEKEIKDTQAQWIGEVPRSVAWEKMSNTKHVIRVNLSES